MVSVVVVEDHPLMRAAVVGALTEAGDITIAATCADGEDAVDLVLRERPDVVVMDLRLRSLDGIGATRRIVAAWPRARILIYTTASTGHIGHEARAAGALAVVSKSARVGELIEAVRAAACLAEPDGDKSL
jgi:DNA-binding NarL/FixJ family response regulator